MHFTSSQLHQENGRVVFVSSSLGRCLQCLLLWKIRLRDIFAWDESFVFSFRRPSLICVSESGMALDDGLIRQVLPVGPARARFCCWTRFFIAYIYILNTIHLHTFHPFLWLKGSKMALDALG